MAKFNLENAPSRPVVQGVVPMPEAFRQGAPVGPRLVGGTSFAGKSAIDLGQIQILAQACLQGLDAARQVVFGWQRQGQSLEDIYIQGITPCARLLGEWWCSDRLDFAMTTIASTHLQQLLHDFSAEFLQESPQQRNGLSLLLLTEPGAQHSMGLFMLSEFFRRSGWRVTLAAPQDIVDFKRLFVSDWFDAVVLSISTDRQIDHIAQAVSELSKATVNPNLKIFVGGPMASLSPDRLNWAGTVTLHSGAVETVDIVSQTVVSAST
jgi:methanogenic corrinoid protein MtbC1